MKIKKYGLYFFLLNLNFFYGQNDTFKINKNGYNVFYYENGIKSSEGLMKSGKPDGYWKNYYSSGSIKNEGLRKNFLLDSIWKFYFENGKLNKTINYVNGKKDGYIINYDTAGRVTGKEKYMNDIRSGNSYTYHNNGRVKYLIPYLNGKIDGDIIEFSEDSLLLGITSYKAGFIDKSEKFNRKDNLGRKQGKWKEFNDKGLLIRESDYRDDLLDGYSKEYDEKGNLKQIEKFFTGKKIEKAKELREVKFYKEYFSIDKIKFEGAFMDGYPHGFHYYYNENGKIDSVMFYEDGFLIEKGKADSMRNKIGYWIEYYQDGEIRGSGNYLSGKKAGQWKYQYPNGKLEQEGKFDNNGVQIGEWKWYYENGNLLRQEKFINGKRNGFFADYFEDGKIIEAGEYSDDLKEGFWYYQMVDYLEKGNYLQGERDSIWNAWWTNTGKLRYKGNWSQGNAEGVHVWYNENGKKIIEGNYTGGSKNGTWKLYDAEGILFITIKYEEDEETEFNGNKILPDYNKAMKIINEENSKSLRNKKQ
ncbi:MAG: hypothetical protein ACK452_03875 [Bacteroidota bacterium]